MAFVALTQKRDLRCLLWAGTPTLGLLTLAIIPSCPLTRAVYVKVTVPCPWKTTRRAAAVIARCEQ
ncbi:hypothetical protein BJX65DRAFT_270241 [Aspergillus insuetus]